MAKIAMAYQAYLKENQLWHGEIAAWRIGSNIMTWQAANDTATANGARHIGSRQRRMAYLRNNIVAITL